MLLKIHFFGFLIIGIILFSFLLSFMFMAQDFQK